MTNWRELYRGSGLSAQNSIKSIELEYVTTIGILNDSDVGPPPWIRGQGWRMHCGRGFASPYDLVISKSGHIFVLNRADPLRRLNMRINVCTMDEEYLGEFVDGYGDGDGQLLAPVAMAFDSQERLYVTDEQTHRISIFESHSGDFIGKWGKHGSGEGQVTGPAGIAIGADDNVYVTDQHHRVQKFSTDGQYIMQWGEHGSGNGQFNLPWGVTVDSQGNVWVADWRNDRIQKFTADGKFLAKYGESGNRDGQFNRPSSVTVDPDGYVYVADWGNERVQVLGPDGRFQQKLKGQAGLSKWAKEFFTTALPEKQTRDIANLIPDLPSHLSSPYHVSSQTEPYFWGLTSVKLDSQGRLYVAESNRSRFQVYRRK